MNILDLTKLDVKDLQKVDYKKLWIDIKKSPDSLIMLLIVISAIIFSICYYQKRSQELGTLRNDVIAMRQKVDLVKQYNFHKNEINLFLKDLPKELPQDELIAKLTDMAVKRGVKIESFTPAAGSNEKLYKSTNLRFEISSDRYQQIWLFTYDIEHAGYLLRVENWNGSMEGLKRSFSRKAGDNALSQLKIGLEIAAIEVNKE